MPETSSSAYGLLPDTGVYRVAEDPPKDADGNDQILDNDGIAALELEIDPCDTVIGAVQNKGRGGIFIPSTDDGFAWKGVLTIFRPAGQITLDPGLYPISILLAPLWRVSSVYRQNMKTVMLAVAQERSWT